MAITPQEIPSNIKPRNIVRATWLVVLVILLLVFAGAWWFQDTLLLLLGLSPAHPAPRISTGPARSLPDLSILNDPLFRALRRFDTLELAATSTGRTNPFAPF